MKNYIEVTPLEGIVIGSKEIALGCGKDDVIAAVGAPKHTTENSFFYWGSSLRFDFEEDKLVFIEFLGGIDGPFQPVIYGKNAFELTADELIALLIKHDSDIIDTDKGCSYSFKNISVGVYRESTPESVSEMVRESAQLGSPMSAEVILHEKRMANHWATLGIGVKDYYNK